MPPASATALPRFLPNAARLVRAPAAAKTSLQSYLAEMDFAGDLSGGVTPYAHDPLPEVQRGGRRAEGWRYLFEVDTDKRYNNGLGNVHGAAQSWLVDNCSTFTISELSLDGFWGEPMRGGVSLAIDVKYFQPCPIGRKLAVVVRIDRLGRTLGNSTTDIYDWETGVHYSAGVHVHAWSAGKKTPEAKL